VGLGAMIIVSATAWWAMPHTRQFKDKYLNNKQPSRVGTAHLNRLTGSEWWAMPTLRLCALQDKNKQ